MAWSLHVRRTPACAAAWPAVIVAIMVVTLLPLMSAGGTMRAHRGVPGERERLVRDFMAAFNSHDVEAMLGFVDDEIQWLSVDGPKITVEVEGKKALGESMDRYFKSCPTCRSSMVWVQSTSVRVTGMERATWTAKSGPKAQSGLSVYEFKGDKILRVYYFPVERE